MEKLKYFARLSRNFFDGHVKRGVFLLCTIRKACIIPKENHPRLSGCFFHSHSEKKGGGAYDFFRVDRDFDLRDRVHHRVKKEITAPSPKDSG